MVSETWTEGEVSVLIRHGDKFSDMELVDHLPKRTSIAIKRKRHRLGILKRDAPVYQRISPEVKQPSMRVVDLAKPPEFSEIMVPGISEEKVALTLFISHIDGFSLDTLRKVRDLLTNNIRRRSRKHA